MARRLKSKIIAAKMGFRMFFVRNASPLGMGAEALTTNILLLRVINRTLYGSQAEEKPDSINDRNGTIKRRVFAGS
jgi:hypothetical protein